ncbi:MAG TPA: GNAT family N-acetyltransferase [Chryseolinea sp.]|nr:GNAT family N-acetyltransferase [Chryseolinea sp.]
MSIVVRLMAKEEGVLANNFFNAIYKSNRSLKDFEWEFINGPAGPSIYVIAFDLTVPTAEKVVGIQCAIPIVLIDSSGERVMTAKSEDTLVDPAYRGQKIFERMYDLLFEECRKAAIKYIWGFTPAKKAFERIGFDIPFQAHQALMVFNPLKAYSYLATLNAGNGIIQKMKIAGLSFSSWLLKVKGARLHTNPYTLKNVEWDSTYLDLKKLTLNSNYYFLEMSPAYIRWRISNNPLGNNYASYHCFDGDKLVANCIINIREPRLGYIEQIIFDGQLNAAQKRQIISILINEMRGRVDLIRCLCFDTNAALTDQEAIYKQHGFIVLRRGAHFVWKTLLEDRLLDPKELFLSRLFTQGNQ